jgi:hypothetical protein
MNIFTGINLTKNITTFVSDFRQLSLSKAVRHRLASIDESRMRSPNQKMALVNLLFAAGCDHARGLYIPLSSHVTLKAKLTEDFGGLPQAISAASGTSLSYFGNALLIPAGYGRPGFDIDLAPKPLLRATNPGFVVVTIEHDCQNRDQFEEVIFWTTPTGGFGDVDVELRKHKDYAGFCIVYSGNKSLHFHFVFDTRHLIGASFDATSAERWLHRDEQSAIMDGVHQICWDRANEVMHSILNPSMTADQSLRKYTQFRRTPWGIRKLKEPSEILGTPAGTLVPQLVISEKIRVNRAAKGSSEFLVAPDYSNFRRSKLRDSTRRMDNARQDITDADVGVEIINELASMCQLEWGSEYPKPVSMEQEKGEWVIRFRNHSGDTNPSTVAKGDYCTLYLCGAGAPAGKFRLPNSLTAQELGDHLARRFGLIRPSGQSSYSANNEAKQTPFQRLKITAGMPFMQTYEEQKKRSFPHVSTRAVSELRDLYRNKLAVSCAEVRLFDRDHIILSVEGIGKTHAHFPLMAEEAMDTALASHDRTQRFYAFAFRSLNGATEKALEYSDQGRKGLVLKPFWEHYADICIKLDYKRIEKEHFEEVSDIIRVLGRIKAEQPAAFLELELLRKSFWTNSDKEQLFNGATMLFTTHATVMTWNQTHLNRIWHHPRFDPNEAGQDLIELRKEFSIERVVFDEPEPDEFVDVLSASMFNHLSDIQKDKWHGLPISKQREVFELLVKTGKLPEPITFEDYDQLRRLDLGCLQQVKVDFDGARFGRENSPDSIYRRLHGEAFYLGPKQWPFSSSTKWTFLTTERWVTEVIAAVYKKQKKRLIRLDLDNLPGIYPVHVPVAINRMAKAQEVRRRLPRRYWTPIWTMSLSRMASATSKASEQNRFKA